MDCLFFAGAFTPAVQAQEALCGGVGLGQACPGGIGESDGNLCTVPTCNGILIDNGCEGFCALFCGLPGCDPEIIVVGVCQDGDGSNHSLQCPSNGETCTTESCNPTNGCISTNRPNGTFCNDGVFCDGTDFCQSGQCTGHQNPPCGAQCTVCNEITDGCQTASNFSPCNDGLFCNGADSCIGGQCSLHINPPCPGADGDADCSESCNEGADACSSNDPNGSACLNDANVCTNDLCAGGVCTHPAGNAGVVCNAASGLCDIADACDGVNAGYPSDAVKPLGTLCRGEAGICDTAESCDGTSPDCPTDAFKGSSTTCRPGVDVCDVADLCDGNGPSCPPDQVEPDGDNDGFCDPIDNCVGVANALQEDSDLDGAGDVCDLCPAVDQSTFGASRVPGAHHRSPRRARTGRGRERSRHGGADPGRAGAYRGGAVGGSRTGRPGPPDRRLDRIRHAIRKIDASHPELGQHLGIAIQTGMLCSYRPDRTVVWDLAWE